MVKVIFKGKDKSVRDYSTIAVLKDGKIQVYINKPFACFEHCQYETYTVPDDEIKELIY